MLRAALGWVVVWRGSYSWLFNARAFCSDYCCAQRGVVRIAHRFVVADLNVAAVAAVDSNKILFPFSVVGCSR